MNVLVGLTSLAGSVCWFSAFRLQTVAYVNALGQVELILSMAVSTLCFKERMTWREGQGLILLSVSVLALILVTWSVSRSIAFTRPGEWRIRSDATRSNPEGGARPAG